MGKFRCVVLDPVKGLILADGGWKCLAVFVAGGKTTEEYRRRNTLQYADKGTRGPSAEKEILNLIGVNYLWPANLNQLYYTECPTSGNTVSA
jgi:hypothetical protein